MAPFKKTYLAAVTNNRVRGSSEVPNRARALGKEFIWERICWELK